jgi:hypothetical protein
MSKKANKIEEKKKLGRPQWTPNEQTIREVESLAATGLTETQIAAWPSKP